MSWISRVFGDFDILEGITRFEELVGESLQAEKLNGVVQLTDPEWSEVETAVSEAGTNDRIELYGDITATSRIDVPVSGITIEHKDGVLTLNSNAFRANGGAINQRFVFNHVTGPGHSSGYTLLEADNAGVGKLELHGEATDIGTVFYQHGLNGHASDWDVYYAQEGSRVEKHVDLHADGFNAEGCRIFGGTMFGATYGIHVHGTDGIVGKISLHGTTIHTSEVPRNVGEIVEEGNSTANQYRPDYIDLGGNPDDPPTVTLINESVLEYKGLVYTSPQFDYRIRNGLDPDYVNASDSATLDGVPETTYRVPPVSPGYSAKVTFVNGNGATVELQNENGELTAIDDAGNRTTLS